MRYHFKITVEDTDKSNTFERSGTSDTFQMLEFPEKYCYHYSFGEGRESLVFQNTEIADWQARRISELEAELRSEKSRLKIYMDLYEKASKPWSSDDKDKS